MESEADPDSFALHGDDFDSDSFANAATAPARVEAKAEEGRIRQGCSSAALSALKNRRYRASKRSSESTQSWDQVSRLSRSAISCARSRNERFVIIASRF